MSIKRFFAFLIAFIFLLGNSYSTVPEVSADSPDITLQIAKSVDKTAVAPGEVFTYTLDYSISGTDPAVNAKIVDVLPAGLEYVSSIKTVHIASVATSTSDGRDVVTFTFTTPCNTGVSGKLRISARFKDGTTTDGATAVNNATFSSDGLEDVVSNDVTVTANIKAPSWSVTKTQTIPSGEAVGGYPVQYRIRVNGNASGSLNLENVRITDTLPTGATFVSATNGGSQDPDTGLVSWTIASIPVGSYADRYVTVTYPEGQTEDVVNNVSVTAKFHGDDADQAEKTASCTTSFGVANPGMGTIVKTNRQVQEEYHTGQTAKYGINGASNTGNVPLDNFTIEDAMPNDIDLTSITTGNFSDSMPLSVYYTTDTAEPYTWTLWKDTTTTANQSLAVSALGLPDGTHITRVQWRLGTVPAGFSQTAMISIQGVIRQDAFGSVTNTAYLDSDYNGSALPGSHSSVVFNLVDAIPWLAPAKALQGDTQRDFNDNVTWTLTVKNHDYATGLLVDPVAIDVLPSALQYVSYTASTPSGVSVGDPQLIDQTIGGKACKVLRWQITGSLEPGDAITINLVTKIADQTPVGWLTNKLYITTNDPGTPSMKGTLTTDTDDLDGDGFTTDQLAGTQAQVFVKFQGALTTQSWVKGELDDDWTQYSSGHYGQTLPGGLANYRFTIKNDGSNGPISNIVAIDLLPTIGDRLIVGGAARGTQWKPYLVNSITGPDGTELPGQLKIYYTTKATPSYAELYDPINGSNSSDGWSETPPADITSVTALKFEFNDYTLNPGDELAFEWPMRAPQGAPAGKISWDSMAIGATCDGSDGPEAFLPTESSKVGFIINDEVPYFGVGDHVWVDTNGNGIQDSGEPGVNDVLVNLYAASAPGTVIAFTRTGDNQSGNAGYYSFPSLIANGTKQYIIEYVFPDSYRQTVYNADGASGDSDTNTDSDVSAVTVGGGQVKGRITFTSPDYSGYGAAQEKPDRLNYDLGIFKPASISGLAWNDVDQDGIRDSGEAKLANVTVNLRDQDGNAVLDANGDAVDATTTDADGSYSFTNLKPGSYKVLFTNPEPANFVFTTADAGSNDTLDSDTDASGTLQITLLSGDSKTSLDSGLHKGMLQGKVWHDLNADGKQDGGSETGLSGITVKAHLGGSAFTTTTAADGSYTFSDLDSGDYTVEVVPGSYYITYKDAAGDTLDSDIDPTSKYSDSFALGTGETISSKDCGLFKPATIGNLVWNDKNWNGVQDAGETGISGVTVTLTDLADGTVKDVTGADISPAITDADGIYSFANLRPGTYKLTVTNPSAANYIFTATDAGSDDAKDNDASSSGVIQFTVTSNASNQTIDAGLHKGMLQGKVWHDLNADGIQAGGSETGLSGITVKAHIDGNTFTTMTAADGSYSFIDLDSGDYTVEVAPGAYYVTYKDATGDTLDSDINPASNYTDSFTLGAGLKISSIDCGLFKPATIGDYVWNDKNWNGVQDAGETALSGVTVTLTDQANGAVKDVTGADITSKTTDANGNYTFNNLRPGAYKLTVTNPSAANYLFTTTDAGGDDAKDSDVNSSGVVQFSVTSNANTLTIDAGLHKGIIQGKVWHDLNADGIQAGGSETGLSGISVKAHIGSTTLTATTAGDGSYSFSDLDAGDYTIEVVPGAYYATYKDATSDTLDSDIDPTTNTTDSFALGAGLKITSKDCGLFKPATIGDFVWNDKDKDGVQDAGEPGLNGVAVSLLTTGGAAVNDVTGSPIGTFTTSGGTGAYSFTLVRPGTYKLHFSTAPEYILTAKLQGGNTATDSDADSATGDTANFSVQSNTTYTSYDAGLYKAGIGDLVWEDTDADGVQDAGEPGIAGVEVQLYLDNGDSVPGAEDTLASTTTTDVNGRYSFTELDHGSYYIRVMLPNGYYATTKGATTSNLDSNIDANGYTAVFPLGVGQSDNTFDAGLFRAATVGDKAWEDLNANGTQDSGEPGVANAVVNILDGSGNAVTDVTGTAISSFTTDASGLYQITGLRPGSYKLQFVLPNGYIYSPTTGTAALGSDAVAPNGWTAPFTLVSNQTNSDIDGGYYRPASISGHVWKETTNNGLQDAGEAAIAGKTVELLNSSNATIQSTTTDTNGDYSFTGITPGAWHVHVVESNAKLFFTQKDAGSDDTKDSDVDSTGNSAAVTLVSNQSYTHMDAGIQNCADIAVSKTADKASYRLADTIVFTVTVTNQGPDDATHLKISDTLPTGINYVSDDSSGAYDSSTGIWNIGSLASGDSQTLKITASSASTGSYTNTAALSSLDQQDHFSANNSSSATFTVENAADVAVTKTVDNDTPWLNDTVVFTIKVDNNGPDSATGTKVSDPLPSSLQFLSDDSSGKYNSSTGVWSIGSLASGHSATIHISAKVKELGETTNTATASANEYDLHPENNISSCSLVAAARADLAITKTADHDTYAAGDSVAFTLTVTNNGPDDATQVAVTDILPANVLYVSQMGSGYNPTTGIWTIGNLADGDSKTLTIITTAGQSGEIDNSASVTGHEADPDSSNNTASVSIDPELCSIGDCVWVDSNANGIQDAGEPGLADVEVKLYHDNGDGIINGSDTLVGTVTTDGDGLYSFLGLSDGSYYVRVMIPDGWLVTTRHATDADADSNIDSEGYTQIFTLVAGQEDSSQDAGLFRTAMIGDRVWEDLNADGTQDAGEPGIVGAVVKIRDGSGNTVSDVSGTALDTFTTGTNGKYEITNLRPGSYKLQFVLPDGYIYSPTTGTVSAGSDAQAPNGWTDSFTLTSDEANIDVDGGFYRSASLSGRVWKETTNNGLQDSGETGIAGKTVKLLDSSDAVSQTTTTDTNGNYSFTGITPGQWHVLVVETNTKLFFAEQDVGSDDDKDSDVDSTGASAAVTLISGQDYTHMDAGIENCADIAVTKTSDKTSYNLGKPILFTITAENQGPDDATHLKISDALPAGIEYVSDDSSGLYNSTTGIWNIGSLASGASKTLKITASSTATGDFTNTAALDSVDQLDSFDSNNSDTASFTVGKAADLAVTKTVDNDSPWLGDTVVYTIKAVNNGPDDSTGVAVQDLLPSSLQYVSDDSNGSYDADTGAWDISTLAKDESVTLKITAKAVGRGAVTNTATVTAHEYDPQTANNEADCPILVSARADLAITKTASKDTYASGDSIGFTLTVTNNGPDDATQVAVADTLPANATYSSQTGSGYNPTTGIWTIGSLAVGGTATLTIHTTAGQTGVIDNSAAVTGYEADPDPSNNSASVSVDPKLCSIGDRVWLDANANGIQDASETGLADVEVRLYHDNGDGVINGADTLAGTDTTDTDGLYAFSGLDDGTYYIRVMIPSGYYATAKGAANDYLDSNINATGYSDEFTLVAGQADNSRDAGLFRTVTIGDRVWEDLNADGTQDAGEPGIVGAVVKIRDGSGNTVSDVSGTALDSVTTGANGKYEITNLRPGSYKLQFVLPNGYIYSPTTGTDSAGSDAKAPNGWTNSFTLASDEANIDIDGGFYRTASLSGRVWKETTNNGLQDAGETGIAGKIVELRNNAGGLVQSMVTRLDGSYAFTSLTPGEYHVLVYKANSKLFFAQQNVGSDDAKDSDVDSNGTSDAVTLISGQNYAHMDAGIENCTDIAVTKTSDKASYSLGKPIQFTITTANLGPDDATHLMISDALPAGILYVSDDSSGLYNSATGIWNIGSLASGASKTLTITATSTATGDFTNTAALQSVDQLDSFTGNNSDSASFTVGKAADMAVTKTVDNASPWLGDTVQYTIHVVNNGPDGATGATVHDLLPSSLQYASDDSSGSYNADTGVWSIGTLAKGQSATLKISAKAVGRGSILNTATVSAHEYDPQSDNNEADCPILVSARADLAITKTASQDTYASGDSIAFTLTVTNNGPDAATQVTVADTLPANAIYVSQSGGYNPTTGVWTIGSLAVGGTATLTIQTTAGQTGVIDNSAVVHGYETDPVPGNNTDSVSIDPKLCSAGDRVWLDKDGNGIQNSGEPGIANVTVTLLNDTGSEVAATKTDADGLYRFSNVPSAKYRVKASLPDKYIMTKVHQGSDTGADSDGGADGATGLVLLQAGLTDNSIDFGMFIPNSITCRVWFDTNHDGTYDTDESPLAGVLVELYKSGVLYGKTVTDASGIYSFTNLPDGDYSLKFTPPDGLDFTKNSEVNITDGTTASITLGGGQTATIDSGFVELSSPATGTADHTILLGGSLLLLLGLALFLAGFAKKKASR